MTDENEIEAAFSDDESFADWYEDVFPKMENGDMTKEELADILSQETWSMPIGGELKEIPDSNGKDFFILETVAGQKFKVTVEQI